MCMKRCKADLNTSEINTKIEIRNALERVRDDVLAVPGGTTASIEVPEVLREDMKLFEKMSKTFAGKEIEVDPETAPDLVERLDQKILETTFKAGDLEEKDVCSKCPEDAEFLSINSKDSSKALRGGVGGLGLAGFTFGITALPMAVGAQIYTKKENYFRDCVDKFDDAKKVRANWSALVNLDNVSKMENLEELIVNNNFIEDIEGLRDAKNLNRFVMRDNGMVKKVWDNVIDPVDVEPLSTIPSLEVVDLKNSPVTNVASLSKLRNLESLNLSFVKVPLEEVKDIIINNENLRFLNMMLSGIPQFKCKGTTFKSMRISKKKEIDKLRECLIEESIEVSPRGKTAIGRLEKAITKTFGKDDYKEPIEEALYREIYGKKIDCDGNVDVSIDNIEMGRYEKTPEGSERYAVITGSARHDLDCTRGMDWSEPEPFEKCVRERNGEFDVVPSTWCEKRVP